MKKSYKYTLLCILVVVVLVTSVGYYLHRPYTLPKVAWMYWNTPEQPALIQQIHAYNRRRMAGWTIRFLNKETVTEYIPASTFPARYSTLKPAHQADWIRVYLLSEYGGVWIDASIIVNDGAALDRLWEESVATRSEFTGFSLKNDRADCMSPRGVSIYIENWFIMAPKESSILHLWRAEYERAIDQGFDAYRDELEAKGVDVHLVFGTGKSTYLTQHACLQMVLQKRLWWIPPMIVMHSEKDMFKIHGDRGWKDTAIMRFLVEEPERARQVPYIKLRSSERSTNIDISKYLRE